MKKNNVQHSVGKPVIFIMKNQEAGAGIITEVIQTDNGVSYKIREFPSVPTIEDWKYHTIAESQVIALAERK